MSFLYKHFGIPRRIEDFLDLSFKGKPVDIYVKNSLALIPPQHIVEYGLQHIGYSLTLQKYTRKIKLGKLLKDEALLDIGRAYRDFMQGAILICEGFSGARVMPTINGDSLERAKQKFNLLESKLVELENCSD